ncbi:MAG: succinylglutamate desuccinylase/aspartoacylase family protein [Planctomycetes bacterium]|nr:succinylglutamate desuccinylase/aspartoacylase family protein [Planctomycetota bacterium]
MKSKTVEGQTTGPHLLITGGVHGDEFEPMAAIRRLIVSSLSCPFGQSE